MSRPAPTRLLLVGSSIFAAWHCATDLLPHGEVTNRAVGGTVTADWVVWLADILTEESPDLVLFYCGSYDLNRGVTEDDICANVARCRSLTGKWSPQAKFAYFGIMKAPQKEGKWHVIDEVNQRISSALLPGDLFVDPNDIFFQDGTPLACYYVADGLHLTDAAYACLLDYSAPIVSDWLDS